MTTILTMMKSKWIKYLLGALLLIGILWWGGKAIHDNIYEDGYTAGIAKQTETYAREQAKAKQEFDILQSKADDERAELNNKIASLSQSNKALQQKLNTKESKTNQEKINYGKTNAGSMSCFAPDDSGLRIINESFPTFTYR